MNLSARPPAASQAPRTRSKDRSQAVKAALAGKRAAFDDPLGFYPCLWCAAAISDDRAKNAILRGGIPKYCGEPCRLNRPEKALVSQIYGAALGVSKDDENAWRENFALRCAAAVDDSAQPVITMQTKKKGPK